MERRTGLQARPLSRETEFRPVFATLTQFEACGQPPNYELSSRVDGPGDPSYDALM
jgi:hypothetical protein